MINRYKVRLNIWCDFELDGRTEKDVEQQVLFAMTKTNILELKEVKKRVRFKIKKINERNLKDSEKDN